MLAAVGWQPGFTLKYADRPGNRRARYLETRIRADFRGAIFVGECFGGIPGPQMRGTRDTQILWIRSRFIFGRNSPGGE
jgi:hypothetical protein